LRDHGFRAALCTQPANGEVLPGCLSAKLSDSGDSISYFVLYDRYAVANPFYPLVQDEAPEPFIAPRDIVGRNRGHPDTRPDGGGVSFGSWPHCSLQGPWHLYWLCSVCAWLVCTRELGYGSIVGQSRLNLALRERLWEPNYFRRTGPTGRAEFSGGVLVTSLAHVRPHFYRRPGAVPLPLESRQLVTPSSQWHGQHRKHRIGRAAPAGASHGIYGVRLPRCHNRQLFLGAIHGIRHPVRPTLCARRLPSAGGGGHQPLQHGGEANERLLLATAL